MPTTVNDRELRGADFRVGICEQTTKGEINSNPTFDSVRRTEGKNWKQIGYVEDPSVNHFMQAKQQIKATETLSAELQTVVTEQTVKWLAQAIHSTIENLSLAPATDIAFTSTGITSGSDAFGNFFVGQAVWVTGSTSNLNDGMYVIASVVDDGEFTTSPPPPVVQAAGASVTITSYVLRNRDFPTYNTMQTRVTDQNASGDINYYTAYDGVINDMTLNIPETGVWDATANFVFENENVDEFGNAATTAISGQTYNAPSLSPALTSAVNSFVGIKGFFVNNVKQNCKLKSLSLSVANNYQEDQFAACRTSYFRGDFSISGNFVARSLVSNPFIWRTKAWGSERSSIAVQMSHHVGSTGNETYVLLHSGVITEIGHPDGSGVVSHAECTFAAEEYQDPTSPNDGTTVTICSNWPIFNAIL